MRPDEVQMRVTPELLVQLEQSRVNPSAAGSGDMVGFWMRLCRREEGNDPKTPGLSALHILLIIS